MKFARVFIGWFVGISIVEVIVLLFHPGDVGTLLIGILFGYIAPSLDCFQNDKT